MTVLFTTVSRFLLSCVPIIIHHSTQIKVSLRYLQLRRTIHTQKEIKQKNSTKTVNFPTYWEVLGSNIGQGTRGHGFDLDYITALAWRGWRKPRNTSVKVYCVRAKSWNMDFWNNKWIVQRCSQLWVTFEAKMLVSTKKSAVGQMKDVWCTRS